MTIRLLQTKLHTPAVSTSFVSRQRLLEKLDAGKTAKLIIVSAPAGFGKTSLVSEWVAGRRPAAGGEARAVKNVTQKSSINNFCWLSLDENDNDPALFWLYFIAAMRTIPDILAEGVGETAFSLLQAPPSATAPPNNEALLGSLINELVSAPPFTIILDDYQAIISQPVHEGLSFFVEHMPPTVQVVITSRADPPWPLARWRARRQLVEIHAADLRFTAEETAFFLEQIAGLELSARDVSLLAQRTEGWAAGLQLASLALQGVENESAFIAAFSGSHRFILDYLLEEVWDQQPLWVKDFWRKTAVLERLSAPLCDFMLAENGAPQTTNEERTAENTLSFLERANLFLIPLDSERHWYRYHRLFADLLRARVEKGLIMTQHRRAAIWFEAHDYTADAFAHWLQAGGIDEAARLVEVHGLSMLGRGELLTLNNWLGRLPITMVEKRPWLAVYQAWCFLLTGRGDQVERYLGYATAASEDQEIHGHNAAIRSYLSALMGNVPLALSWAQQALDDLAPADQITRSVVTYVLGGMKLMIGDFRGAVDAFMVTGESGRMAGNFHVAVPALSSLANLQRAHGKLRRAAATLNEARQLALTDGGRPLPIAASVYSGLAHLHFERDELPEAAHWVRAGLALAERWGNLETAVNLQITAARIHMAQGDAAAAEAAWQQAAEFSQGHTLIATTRSELVASRLFLLLEQGRLETAAHYAAEQGLHSGLPAEFAREMELLALVRLLAVQGMWEEAGGLLDRLIAAARADGRSGSLVKLLASQSVLYAAQGQKRLAEEAWQEAHLLAGSVGFSRSLAFGQSWFAEGAARSLSQPLLDPLSERELEVLRLMAQGKSNQGIADELIVAVGTVKAHTSAIFRKLDVHSRTQAVARAGEIGLI